MKQPHHILAVRIAHPVWTLFLLALALAVDHTGIVRLGFLCSCLHECGHLLVWVLLTRLPPTLIYLSNRFLSFPAWGGADAKAVYHSCRCGASGQSGAGGRGHCLVAGPSRQLPPVLFHRGQSASGGIQPAADPWAGWLADQLQPGYPVSFQDPNPEAFLRELRLHFALFWAII